MEILEIKKLKKNLPRFECKTCDFKCNMKIDWSRHLATSKHAKITNGNEMEIKNLKSLKKNLLPSLNDITENSPSFHCSCGKIYATSSGLWKHQKKCALFEISPSSTSQNEIITNNNNTNTNNVIQHSEFSNLTNLICELVKSNAELQKSMFEICKQGQNNYTSNISNNNCNNKTFNLQVFLNETCKDAMNISDFVESVKLQVSDLENVGKVGYIEGISNIIIKNLNALEVEKRPVHCTDQKREVIYVKEDNIWEKEDEANKKLRKAIRMIAHKNICMFKEFREKYPDCEEYDSKKNSQYNTIIYEAMGGKGDNDYEKDTKIIKKIAKNVTIDKNI